MHDGDPPHHSADLTYWWDGRAWRPAISADTRNWFDVRAWVPRPAIVVPPAASNGWSWPKSYWPAVTAWVVTMSTVALTGLLLAPQGKTLSSSTIHILIGGAAASVAGSPPLGFALGRQRRWKLVPVTAAAGAAVVAFWYCAVMAQYADPNDPTSDNAAGAGLAIGLLPTFLAFLVLVAAGAGVGHLRRSRS